MDFPRAALTGVAEMLRVASPRGRRAYNFITAMVNKKNCSVYRYQDGLLHYYTQDHDSTLTDAQMTGLPGTRVPESPVPYPTLNQLKRVHISKTSRQNSNS